MTQLTVYSKLDLLMGKLHLTQNWAYFEHYLMSSKLSTTLKNDLIILKQIIWESSKMAFKF